MLQELRARRKEVNLKINAAKTKVMWSLGMPKVKVLVDGVDLEEVTSTVMSN